MFLKLHYSKTAIVLSVDYQIPLVSALSSRSDMLFCQTFSILHPTLTASNLRYIFLSHLFYPSFSLSLSVYRTHSEIYSSQEQL